MHKPLTPTYRVNWRDFNDPLCQLVDKSGGKHEVEVDFRFKNARAMELEVGELTGELKVVRSLAKLREKGRMGVVCMDPGGNESVVCSSNGTM